MGRPRSRVRRVAFPTLTLYSQSMLISENMNVNRALMRPTVKFIMIWPSHRMTVAARMGQHC